MNTDAVLDFLKLVPEWYYIISFLLFFVLSTIFCIAMTKGDELSEIFEEYVFHGYVFLFAVIGILWLPIVIILLVAVAILRGIDTVRNWRNKNSNTLASQANRPPEDEYTMQLRVYGTIPPMRTLYLRGSRCKVVTRRPDKEGEPQ